MFLDLAFNFMVNFDLEGIYDLAMALCCCMSMMITVGNQMCCRQAKKVRKVAEIFFLGSF